MGTKLLVAIAAMLSSVCVSGLSFSQPSTGFSQPESNSPQRREGIIFFRGGLMQSVPCGDTAASPAEFGTKPSLGLWLEAGGSFSPYWGGYFYLGAFGGTVSEPRPTLLQDAPADAEFGLDRGVKGVAVRVHPWGLGELAATGLNPYFTAGLGLASIETGRVDTESEQYLSLRTGFATLLGVGVELHGVVGDTALPSGTLDFSVPAALALGWHPVFWQDQTSPFFGDSPADDYSLGYFVFTLVTGFEVGH